MIVSKTSSTLSRGAEVATTPVNNETITAIDDWRNTTIIHEKREDGLDLRPRVHDVPATMLDFASSSPVERRVVQRLHSRKSMLKWQVNIKMTVNLYILTNSPNIEAFNYKKYLTNTASVNYVSR